MLSVMRMFTDALTSCPPPVSYFIVSSENLALLYVPGLEKHIKPCGSAGQEAFLVNLLAFSSVVFDICFVYL